MESSKNNEKRYQWAITVLVLILGFLAGTFFETERMNEQVITNTVEIQTLKDGLGKIEAKIDQILAERK